MDLEDGLEMIIKAFKKKRRDKEWEMYLAIYPNIAGTENDKPFEELFPESNEEQHKVDSNKSVDDILADVEDILNMKGMKKIDGNI